MKDKESNGSEANNKLARLRSARSLEEALAIKCGEGGRLESRETSSEVQE